ncbi:pyroglutamyl-peptidase I [Actinacidiphila oryziradicis]|uniref:pyroglutamyl-peptidase I family protein n=1 Tax=Actinacidiphila oryziradicis TaxID=2571141 RepID=UPI0023F3F327|nr:pyroglutamyl-peptidase I [Actinacidiphila oryziradicis]MCW2873191.1 peptidase [Actinacidiphila oryziradicis]
MNVVVTGFGAFSDQSDNPSGLLARALNGQRIGENTITGVVLPVATGQIGPALATALEGLRPRLVLGLGVAPGRMAPALERVAINVRDFPVPDTENAQVVDEPVIVDGPDAYLASLPLKAILAAWRAAGLPGYVSNTAGTYLCNQLFYLLAHQGRDGGFRAGFIHLPALPTPAAAPAPSMSLDVMEQAVRIAVDVATSHIGPDLPLESGALS